MSFNTIVPQLDVYHVRPSTIKAAKYDGQAEYDGYLAFDTSKPLIGDSIGNSWLSRQSEKTNQRINIDLGASYVITRILYVNFHERGGGIANGARFGSIYGSNIVDVMGDPYNIDTNLNLMWEGEFNICTFEPLPPFQFPNIPPLVPIVQGIPLLSNINSYRFYVIKILNNWEGNFGIGFRRIELQVDI